MRLSLTLTSWQVNSIKKMFTTAHLLMCFASLTSHPYRSLQTLCFPSTAFSECWVSYCYNSADKLSAEYTTAAHQKSENVCLHTAACLRFSILCF